MAISVNWITGEIFVPKADTQLVSLGPPEVRQHDTDAFRLELKDLEDDAEGRPWPRTHNHNLPVTIAGVTYARTFEVIPPYFVTYEDGQYRVSLTGSNNNIIDVATVNQVGIISNNSAGLTFSDQINQQSFASFVWIDTTNGLSGVSFPRGTPTDPVNNWADADTIADDLNLENFKLRHALTMPVSEALDAYTIEGLSPIDSQILFQGGTCQGMALRNLSFGGTMGEGYFTARECVLGTLTNFDGGLFNCVINGNITLDATPSDVADISFMNCVSGFPGDVAFTLDYNGCPSSTQFRNWSGGMVIDNFTDASAFMSIDMAQGKVTLNASCTDGQILVRGVGELIDNSGAGCNVVRSGLITPEDVVLARDNARAANQQTKQL